MKMSAFSLSVIILFASHFSVSAQDKELLVDKPGTFKITFGTLNGQGQDQDNKSCGEGQPVVSNDTPVNKALNRRAEFIKLLSLYTITCKLTPLKRMICSDDFCNR
jgi:hypothetical protein